MGVQFKSIMKTNGVSLLAIFALIEFSWEARPPSQSLYGSPSSPPSHHHQPSCKQVPKEVCKQVPKQTYESVNRQQCRDVPDQVCTSAQERTCSIRQRPVQEYSNQKVCSIRYRKECDTANDIHKIGADGHLSQESDAALNKIVTDFIASFSG